MRRSVLTLLISLNCCFAFSQKVIFQTYTVRDGLVANPVHRIFQDSKGFIWICTWEGLSKYDGHKFTNFTLANGLSDNAVNDVYESPDGKLYVALNNGCIDIIENDQVAKGVFRNVVINSFFSSRDKRVFAVTDTNGICELRTGQLKKTAQQYQHASYSRMIALNDSLFAVCSPEIPLRIINPDYQTLGELKSTVSVNECVFQDSHKRLWTGTRYGLRLASFDAARPGEIHSNPTPFDQIQHSPIAPTDII